MPSARQLTKKFLQHLATAIFKIPHHRALLLKHEIQAFTARHCSLWDARQRRLLKRLRSGSGWSLSLGSGRRPFPGWILVDIEPNGPTDYLRWDCRRPLPLRDGSVARILIEHYLEHLDPETHVPQLLTECYRLLQPGGYLRIIVPDAEKFLRAYVAGDSRQWLALGYDLNALPLNPPTPMSIINHVFHQRGEHRAAYDFNTLHHILARHGFSQIKRQCFGQSDDPGMNIDRPNHAPYSLYVDCRKP